MAESATTPELVSLRVEGAEDGTRLDSFVTKRLSELSRTRVQALIDEGKVLVNDRVAKASHKLVSADLVKIDLAQKHHVAAPPVVPVGPLDIVFEDEHIIVVNKPVGMVVHQGAGETGPTLADALRSHTRQLSQVSPDRPGIVHRLDKDTSGLLVCAKTDAAHHHLSKQFKEKTNYRQYCALLDGYMEQAQVAVESMIARDPAQRTRMKSYPMNHESKDDELPVTGRWSRSHFFKTHTFAHRLSLVRVQLETGRTHQIRVHAKDLKMPVWGDQVYQRASELPSLFDSETRAALKAVSHQMLHAQFLGFEHPATGEKLAFEAPLPADFAGVLKVLQQYQDP